MWNWPNSIWARPCPFENSQASSGQSTTENLRSHVKTSVVSDRHAHGLRDGVEVDFADPKLTKPKKRTPMGFVSDERQLRNQRLDGYRLYKLVIHIDAPRHKPRHTVGRHVVFVNRPRADEAQSRERLQRGPIGIRLTRLVVHRNLKPIDHFLHLFLST